MIITSIYASLLAVLFFVLSARVILLRRVVGVGLNDGGNDYLRRLIRVHGNFAEYVPHFAPYLICRDGKQTPMDDPLPRNSARHRSNFSRTWRWQKSRNPKFPRYWYGDDANSLTRSSSTEHSDVSPTQFLTTILCKNGGSSIWQHGVSISRRTICVLEK